MTVGILGGGQLGRMLALEGMRLGLDFLFVEPRPEAVRGLGETIVADYHDPGALAQVAARCQAVTYEFENIPVESLAGLPHLWPPVEALAASQDRLLEKQVFQSLGIPTAPFWSVEQAADLEGLAYPLLLKTRRLGYDGKGQARVGSAAQAREFLALGGGPWIAEELIVFERELSTLAVRSRTGEVGFYPMAENCHREGILRQTVAPASAAPEAQGRELVGRLLEHFDYVGVLTVEWFDCHGQLLANELAPRVHNSGHWTQDGAVTSQFENHLRAGLGWPLGDCGARGRTRMDNLIGEPIDAPRLAADPRARLHLYGKAPRPGRKLGHVNRVEVET